MDREPPPSPGSLPSDSTDWPHVVTADWVDAEEWARMCAVLGEDEEPPDPVQAFYDDPDCGPPPGGEQETWEALTARAGKDGAEYEALIGRLAAAGHSESAHVAGAPPVPGSPEGPAAGFGQGRPLDTAVPSTVISGLADEASGEARAFQDVTDDQLMGLIGARARLVARQHWEQLTAVAEFIRRRPHPTLGRGEKLPGDMPAAPSDDAGADLAAQLHITGTMAGALTGLAHDLMVKLPLTRAALRDGIIDIGKARSIVAACWPLTPEQARRAERILFGLDSVEEMTWGMIRDRIARAVMEVDPDGARRRREDAERQKRVEVFPEHSGNAHISGRELPPAAALAADQNLDARARELRAAGVPGDMDNLRALAYLEMLGAGSPLDTIPASTGNGSTGNGSTGNGSTGDRNGDPGAGRNSGNGPGGPDGPGPGGPGGPGPGTPGGGAVPGQVPPGFTAKVNLTIPLATLLGLAERPGMMSRTGPVDPALARTLAAAAARDPRHPDHPRHPDDLDQQGRGASHRPSYIPAGDHDPPGTGTGTLSLNIAALTGNTGAATGGARELVFALENLAGPCDHAHEAAGHDPGVMLKHLTGILNDCCTFPPCRRPHQQCDYEHSTPHDQGGRTCLCQGGPVCRRNHRNKQTPGWHLEHGENRGWFRWTTASGRTYTSRPTQYPD